MLGWQPSRRRTLIAATALLMAASLISGFGLTSSAAALQTQTINFTSTAPNPGIVGGPTYHVTATGGESGNPVTFAVDESSLGACTISESTVTFVSAGTCTIDANQAAGGEFAAAEQRQQAFLVKKAQAVEFTSVAPNPGIVGTTYHVTATGGGSESPVTFAVDPSSLGACTISESTVTFVAAGTCTIDADQAAGGEFAAAPQEQQSFPVAAPPPVITIVPGPKPPPPPPPPPPPGPTPLPGNSSFTAGARSFEPTTGRVIFIETIKDPGTFSWLLTVPNGKFGVFAARSKCKAGYVRLAGKCRPSKIVFATGSATVPAGVVIFKLRPSPSALKALKNALKLGKGVRVTATFTFQSARGGPPVSHTQTIVDKLKRK
jgi:hypothetical protein